VSWEKAVDTLQSCWRFDSRVIGTFIFCRKIVLIRAFSFLQLYILQLIVLFKFIVQCGLSVFSFCFILIFIEFTE
jgi:hypothetical protein